jgi:UDP-glucose:(heptosyl)LPS alpha-1,3-glucosyltransferase
VHLHPPVEDPRSLYAAADVLVHPTWLDPCSLVCLEALAMALPVVTTRANGVHEIMGRRGGRILDAPGDPPALAAALADLADDEVRARAAEEARAVALENPEVDRLDEVLAHCRRVAGGS